MYILYKYQIYICFSNTKLKKYIYIYIIVTELHRLNLRMINLKFFFGKAYSVYNCSPN